jgi:hypothetical protein
LCSPQADRAVAGAELHTSFQLDEWEYLALVEPDGLTIAQHFAPAFPSQRANISCGAAGYFAPPPPASNGLPTRAGCGYEVQRQSRILRDAVHRCHYHGYGRRGNSLDDERKTAHTGDGHDLLRPIPVTNTTFLRAAAFKPGFIPSDVDTHTISSRFGYRQPAAPPGYPAIWPDDNYPRTTRWTRTSWTARITVPPLK